MKVALTILLLAVIGVVIALYKITRIDQETLNENRDD
jgi:uncharacterized membrane protein (DUF106 family)